MFQAKLDKSNGTKPSKVIHIRNIPNEVTEAEIIHLGIPFGRVTNVLVLKGKNQVSKVAAQPFFSPSLLFNGSILSFVTDRVNDKQR